MISHFQIHVGEHYDYHGEEYQVVDIRGNIIQMRSIKFSTHIVCQTFERLARAARQGYLRKVQEAPFAPNPTLIMAGLSEGHRAKMAQRLAYLVPILKETNGRLRREVVERMAKEIALQRGERCPCYGSIYNWKVAYLRAGEDSLALVPRTHRRSLDRFYRQPVEVQDQIELHLDLLYYTETPASKIEVAQAIGTALGLCNLERAFNQQLPIPSATTLYRIISEKDQYKKDLYQMGFREASKRQKSSSKNLTPYRRFMLVEGDTQRMDVFTCNEDGYPAGRPYLTALMEIRTRIVVGWDISYNPPSLEKTLRALKASLLSSNPYGGLAMRYRVDNGAEFIAAWLKTKLSELGADISYCAPGTPDQKPHIESFFKTWTTSIAHTMRGTTFSRPNRYDSKGNAIYTLEQIREFFKEWLEDIYHPGYHGELKMSPKDAWDRDESRNSDLPFKRYSDDALKRHFLSATYLKPNGNRLRFCDLAWVGGGISFLASRSPGNELRLYYDQSDLGRAWVCDPRVPEEVIEVMPADPEYQNGLTMHLHNLVRKAIQANKMTFDYQQARDAKSRLLIKIAQANQKGRRKRKTIPEETLVPEALECQIYQGEKSTEHLKADDDQYPLHPRTPTNYEVMTQDGHKKSR